MQERQRSAWPFRPLMTACLFVCGLASCTSPNSPRGQNEAAAPTRLAVGDEPEAEAKNEGSPQNGVARVAPCTEVEDFSTRIENGEDGNNQILVQDGRDGYLYAYVDSNGSTVSPRAGTLGGRFSPRPGGANGSRFALGMDGELAQGKGAVFAGMGMSFVDPPGEYDAGHYDGIAFWARAESDSLRSVSIRLPDVNSDPAGGLCSECYNSFAVTIEVSDEWAYYRLLFSDFRQEKGWGDPRPESVESSKLYGLQFQIAPDDTSDAASKFDVRFDDIRFIDCL